MIIKKYIVDALPDAMPMIKRDLGKEAIILNTKKIHINGFLGFFKKQKLEVVAAVDRKEVQADLQEPRMPQQQDQAVPQLDITKRYMRNPIQADLWKEIQNIKNVMVQVLETDKLPKALNALNTLLIDQEVNQEIRSDLIARLCARAGVQNATDQQIVEWAKEEVVYDLQGFMDGIALSPSRIVCFAGPTGVGKTTTIAKIAANYRLKEKKMVGFITSDTYRIAAVEQLRTYAEILGTPIEVATNKEEVRAALQKLNSCDVILMDTAGRNYTQYQYIQELEQLLRPHGHIQKNLVLSLTSKYTDITRIIEQFQNLNIDQLILTKQDETTAYGTILNLMYRYSIPIWYITNGQNVPDDILHATPDFVAKLIFGVEENGGSSEAITRKDEQPVH